MKTGIINNKGKGFEMPLVCMDPVCHDTGSNTGVFYKTYRGRSMFPKFSGGETLVCRPLNVRGGFLWGEIYLIYSSRYQEVIIGRPYPSEYPGKILFVRDNPRFDNLVLSKDEIRSCAQVIGVLSLFAM